MSVVFDEVTATVEVPEVQSPAGQDDESERESPNPAEGILRMLETCKRRASRLTAD